MQSHVIPQGPVLCPLTFRHCNPNPRALLSAHHGRTGAPESLATLEPLFSSSLLLLLSSLPPPPARPLCCLLLSSLPSFFRSLSALSQASIIHPEACAKPLALAAAPFVYSGPCFIHSQRKRMEQHMKEVNMEVQLNQQAKEKIHS